MTSARLQNPAAMKTSPAPDLPVVVLLGNYPPDRQESMLRFRDLLQSGLEAEGVTTESIFPEGRLGRIFNRGLVGKWMGNIDKYLLFPLGLESRLSAIQRKYPYRKIVVHICDHANSVYASRARKWFPVMLTCHDLIAVRGALGEDTDCPATRSGKILQSAIFRGIGHANAIACISRSTQSDLIRLSGPGMAERCRVIPLALNYPYLPLTREEALGALARAGIDLPYHGFILHVGTGSRRKNREALFLSVAQIKESWPGQVVFAGEGLTPAQRDLARSLGLEDRMREISRPDNETLRALYGAAHCLMFMSRFEGFGWPILEAQAAGCPVICSNRTSVPEVAGEGAFIHEPEDYAAMAKDILRLQEPAVRDQLAALGFKNVQGFSIERMIGSYQEMYRQL